MDSVSSSDSSLNGSWVDVTQAKFSSPLPPMKSASANRYSVERLLREAQRESPVTSMITSLASSRAVSPRSPPCTPNSEFAANDSTDAVQRDITDLTNCDWVWDWSSRPEAIPPSDYAINMKHPPSKWRQLSIRNTRIMDFVLFSIENLPVLLITHACSFVLGAATVFLLLKKCYSWPSPLAMTSSAVDG